MKILFPFLVYGEAADGWSGYAGGNDEDEAMYKLITIAENHDGLTFYSSVNDEYYTNGELMV